MTALHMDATSVKKAAAILRAVSAEPAQRPQAVPADARPAEVDSPRQRPVVRPDRPSSVPRRVLRAVPTAASAPEVGEGSSYSLRTVTGPQWKVDTPAVTVRRPQRARRRADERMQASKAGQKPAFANLALKASLVALAALGVIALFVVGMTIATGLGLGMEASHSIFVQPGESLWSIAATLGVDVPTAQVVSDLLEINGLTGTEIVAGQELIIPAY